MKVLLSLDEITRVLAPYVCQRHPGFTIGPNDGKPSFSWVVDHAKLANNETGAVRLEVTLQPPQNGSSRS